MKLISKQNKTIGVPRALSYYNNYPFYYGFLTTLGFEVVLSDKTTTKLINDGASHVVSDTCLPIKVFVGHLINLLDKGINTIFVPSLQSTDYKINNCSKIRGLPEIIKEDENGKLFSPGSVEELTDILDSLKPDILNKWKNQSRLCVKEMTDPNGMFDKRENIIKETIA